MNELIFNIFSGIAEAAMDKGYEIRLRYDTGNSESKTIISQSKRDTNSLEMNCWKQDASDIYEDGYDDGCMDMLDDDLGENADEVYTTDCGWN